MFEEMDRDINNFYKQADDFIDKRKREEMKKEGLTDTAIDFINKHPKEWNDAGKWIQENVLSKSNEETSKFQVM